MDARDDPEYLRLYQDYAWAIQALENAIKDHRRVRDQIAVARAPVIKALEQWGRRPVGSPPGTRIPSGRPDPAGGTAQAPRPHRIYMGAILGWATVVPTATVMPRQPADVSEDIDLDGSMRIRLWSAKTHYEECKRAFFAHVRRRNIDLHRQRARGSLEYGGNLQLLGADDFADDDDDPRFMKDARREVEAVCRNVWALYQSSGAKESSEMKVLLVESIADAQLVGLESPILGAMTSELYRLVESGDIEVAEP